MPPPVLTSTDLHSNLSEPNQQNKQGSCLPSPSPSPRSTGLTPDQPPGRDVALWTWAPHTPPRPANLGTRVTSAALITQRYLCRRLPHRHPSAQPPCHLFCKFTLSLSIGPAPPLPTPSTHGTPHYHHHPFFLHARPWTEFRSWK